MYHCHPETENPFYGRFAQLHAVYHMVNSRRPLEDNMSLLWHQVFATAMSKLMGAGVAQMLTQTEMFRLHGMGNFKTLAQDLAKNTAMIFWLDNNENHKRSPNENWGRELMALFSMGVGNYNEVQDVSLQLAEGDHSQQTSRYSILRVVNMLCWNWTIIILSSIGRTI